MTAISSTEFDFPGLTHTYKGKVRDVYVIKDKYLVAVASDRISAFDVVLPAAIPYKGQVLNQIAAHFLNSTASIVPNWLMEVPDPNVSIGRFCKPFPVEMVIRGYLAGHAWRTYKEGKRELCGVKLPDGLKENEKLPEPIITPTTKASEGHDEDISKDEIISEGIISRTDYEKLEEYTRNLFKAGTKMADERGLILVDTKYEFGRHGYEIILIDEIHTPDSSRYFYKEGYEERQKNNQPQRQLSKEFVRQWLIENNFQGLEGQNVPEMTEKVVNSISERYIELYEQITGKKFEKQDAGNSSERMEKNILKALSKLP